jgi:hypothetical protein
MDSQFGMSTWFSVSMDTGGRADGSGGPDLTLNRIELTVNRIARAPGDCQRAKNDRDGQKLWDQ